MSDDGLTEATQRAMVAMGCTKAWDEVVDVSVCSYCEAVWTDGHCTFASAVARAAREDVADRIQQARADAWDEGWAASEWCDSPGSGACGDCDSCNAPNPHRAAATRDGVQS